MLHFLLSWAHWAQHRQRKNISIAKWLHLCATTRKTLFKTWQLEPCSNAGSWNESLHQRLKCQGISPGASVRPLSHLAVGYKMGQKRQVYLQLLLLDLRRNVLTAWRARSVLLPLSVFSPSKQRASWVEYFSLNGLPWFRDITECQAEIITRTSKTLRISLLCRRPQRLFSVLERELSPDVVPWSLTVLAC